ncbi:MAG: ABC transporter permease [Lachnospiraceae bacterium]|nr:ABC transporter permease [Lachnospiraceae bacterium]
MNIKNSISFKNFTRKPARTAALCLLSVFLSFSVLGGSLVVLALKGGLESLETRLGADIMVVPYEASTKAELSGMVLQGNPGYFYMDRSVLEKLQDMDGVKQVSEQFYLASASASCCSMAVQIIGYNPETDFTINPWIEKSYKGTLGEGEILVGNDLNLFPGDCVMFYGTPCTVAAKLDKTGTYLDTSVYTGEETIKTLIGAAKEKKIYDFGEVDPDRIVSCVLINVEDGYSVEEVRNDIKLHVRKVEAVQTQDMITDVSGQLTGTSDFVMVLIGVLWILALPILGTAFVMIANERKKEFAILRVAGASRKILAAIMMKEALLINVLGSLIGAVLAVALTVLFGSLLESSLGLPFLLPGAGKMVAISIAAVAVSVLAGTLSAVIAAWRISRIDTALILRGEN